MTTLTIDTHHHMLPDFFWRETNAHGVIGGLAPLAWSKEVSLSFMDDAGIDAAVLSVSTPGVDIDSTATSIPASSMNPRAVDSVHSGGVIPPTGFAPSFVSRQKKSGRKC